MKSFRIIQENIFIKVYDFLQLIQIDQFIYIPACIGIADIESIDVTCYLYQRSSLLVCIVKRYTTI